MQNNAPLHLRRKFLSAPIAKELRAKVGAKSIPVRVGDKVKIMRGQFSGTVGKVERTDVHRVRVFVAGAEVAKRNGSKALYPLHPSNLMITDLVLSDKKRMKKSGAAKSAQKSQDSKTAKPATK